ncbi:apiosidase-like domain-containing protein [Halosimplex amylolyticum]|uniref:apiosidase-like domain-containing protein n=1 Tax=Halosimplex amylolyticum TaxID=3396616 RepID=UPI003F556ED9
MAQRWQPVEWKFEPANSHENAYGDELLTATFEHESGTTHEVSGFRYGDGTVRVRFAPPSQGRWTWETHSTDPELRESGTFEATTNRTETALHEHGYLVADERTLRHADGTPFFWLGDTAWSASTRATPEEWADYLDHRAELGYNVVQVNALAQHDASIPHDRLPFGADWEMDSPDPEYFEALDGLVAMAHDRGIVPALVALWFDYVPGANASWDYVYADRHPMTAAQARRLGRYLGARYGAYGTVWLVSGDSEFDEESLQVYRAAAEGLRDACTHPPLTVHQPGGQVTPAIANDEDWLHFHMYQSGHSTDLTGPRSQAHSTRTLDPPRPVLNGEPPYEDMYNRDPDERIDRRTVRAAGWVSVLAGANAGLTYGALGIWNWHREGDAFEAGEDRWGKSATWREALEFRGAEDYARLREILDGFAFDSLEPRPELLVTDESGVEAAVLADALLVYAVDGHRLTLRDPPTVDFFEWVDPGTGARRDAEVERQGDDVRVSPAPFDGDGLLVGRR